MKYKVGDKVKFVKAYTLGTGEVIPANSVWEIKKVLDAHYRFESADKQLVAMIERIIAEDYCEKINDAPSITKRINEKHNILNGLTQTDTLKPQNDSVNHPSHYTDGKIEVIDFIEDKKLGYHLGNACKYICRCRLKNGGKDKVQDLRKAIWYIERQIHLWEG
jgi:hypothetical protein